VSFLNCSIRSIQCGLGESDFGCVEWPGGIDLCPDTMRQAMAVLKLKWCFIRTGSARRSEERIKPRNTPIRERKIERALISNSVFAYFAWFAVSRLEIEDENEEGKRRRRTSGSLRHRGRLQRRGERVRAGPDPENGSVGSRRRCGWEVEPAMITSLRDCTKDRTDNRRSGQRIRDAEGASVRQPALDGSHAAGGMALELVVAAPAASFARLRMNAREPLPRGIPFRVENIRSPASSETSRHRSLEPATWPVPFTRSTRSVIVSGLSNRDSLLRSRRRPDELPAESAPASRERQFAGKSARRRDVQREAARIVRRHAVRTGRQSRVAPFTGGNGLGTKFATSRACFAS